MFIYQGLSDKSVVMRCILNLMMFWSTYITYGFAVICITSIVLVLGCLHESGFQIQDAPISSLVLLGWVLSVFLILEGSLFSCHWAPNLLCFQSDNEYLLNNKGVLKPGQINLQKLKRQFLHYGEVNLKLILTYLWVNISIRLRIGYTLICFVLFSKQKWSWVSIYSFWYLQSDNEVFYCCFECEELSLVCWSGGLRNHIFLLLDKCVSCIAIVFFIV